MSNSIFSNGVITVETFGSIYADMPQIESEIVDYETERLICKYEENRQYVERNTNNGMDLYQRDTEEYMAEMLALESSLNVRGFSLVKA